MRLSSLLLSAFLSFAAAAPCFAQASSGPNVYAQEEPSTNGAAHARAVLSLYAPAHAFLKGVGGSPARPLTSADLSTLFASLAYQKLGCAKGDAACAANAKRMGAQSSERASRSPELGAGINAELSTY